MIDEIRALFVQIREAERYPQLLKARAEATTLLPRVADWLERERLRLREQARREVQPDRDALADCQHVLHNCRKERNAVVLQRDSNLGEVTAYRMAVKEAVDAMELAGVQPRQGEPVTSAIRQLLLEVMRLRPIERAARDWAKSPFGPKAAELQAAIEASH